MNSCRFGHSLLQSFLKLHGTMITHFLEQLVAGRDLDNRRDVSPLTNRYVLQSQFHAEQFVGLFLEPEPVVFMAILPFDKFDDQVNFLAFADCCNTEQVFDIDNPQTTDFHVIMQEIIALAKQDCR